jgi:hypothetical protein
MLIELNMKRLTVSLIALSSSVLIGLFSECHQRTSGIEGAGAGGG